VVARPKVPRLAPQETVANPSATRFARGQGLGHPTARGIDYSADDVPAPKGRKNTAHGVSHGYAARIPDISPGGAKDIIFPGFSDAIASDEPNG